QSSLPRGALGRVRQRLRLFDSEEFVRPDVGHSLQRQLNPIISVLGVPDEEPPFFLQIFKGPNEVSISILRAAVEDLPGKQLVVAPVREEIEYVLFDLAQFISIHNQPPVRRLDSASPSTGGPDALRIG